MYTSPLKQIKQLIFDLGVNDFTRPSASFQFIGAEFVQAGGELKFPFGSVHLTAENAPYFVTND